MEFSPVYFSDFPGDVSSSTCGGRQTDSTRSCVNIEGYILLQPAHCHFNYRSSDLKVNHAFVHLGKEPKHARRIQAGAFPINSTATSGMYVYILGFLLLFNIRPPCLLWGSGNDIIFAPLTDGAFLLGDHGIVLYLSCFFHHLASASDKV